MINALPSSHTYGTPPPLTESTQVDQAVLHIRTNNAEQLQMNHVKQPGPSVGIKGKDEKDAKEQNPSLDRQDSSESAALKAEIRARTIRAQREITTFFLNAAVNISLPAEETRDNPQKRSPAASARGYQRPGSILQVTNPAINVVA